MGYLIIKTEDNNTTISVESGSSDSGLYLKVSVYKTNDYTKGCYADSKDFQVCSEQDLKKNFFFDSEEEAVEFAKELILQEIKEIQSLLNTFKTQIEEYSIS